MYEQLHLECKTHMNLVCLFWGKFDTNFLVCALAGGGNEFAAAARSANAAWAGLSRAPSGAMKAHLRGDARADD